MRVIHVTRNVNGETPLGGLERAINSLSNAQRRLGVEVEVISESDTLKFLYGFRKEQFAPNTKTIFHFHDWYGSRILKQLRRHPEVNLIVTAHLPVRRGFTYLDTEATWIEKAKHESGLFNASAIIISPSEYIKKFLVQEYGISDARIRVVAHGVDSDAFRPVTKNNSNHRNVKNILFVGRITEQKGLELLLRSLPSIFTNIAVVNLTVIGTGDRKDACRELAHRLGIGDFVDFHPFADDAKLAEFYSSSDLLVMPSIFEPFGLVGLEALACGCPVLALSPTGAEYLRPNEQTPFHSPRRLAETIGSALRANVDRGLLRNRALEYTWEAAALSTLSIYRQDVKCRSNYK